MKSLIIAAMLAMPILNGSVMTNNPFGFGLEVQISTEEILQDKVKVYDYTGNLLKELPLADVANDEVSVLDYIFLENSHYAFSYLGDYYYFNN